MSFIATLRQLCQSWWMVDRIRASPSDGRLLSLQPGMQFMIEDTFFMVQKTIRSSPNNSTIEICHELSELQTGSSPGDAEETGESPIVARLRIRLSHSCDEPGDISGRRASLEWTSDSDDAHGQIADITDTGIVIC
ncbi:MAG: hypothetical protein R3C20_17520 [Planctomycetaceae bacterium]